MSTREPMRLFSYQVRRPPRSLRDAPGTTRVSDPLYALDSNPATAGYFPLFRLGSVHGPNPLVPPESYFNIVPDAAE
jgi:hypothetical protein